MSDIKLFRLSDASVTELEGTSVKLEKSIQALIEQNLEAFLGVRFLKSEHPTGKTHGGRIDTLGLDENGFPVIIEYKRHSDENVINQGLYYLDWLMDHQGEFELLVLKTLGQEEADQVVWTGPRLVCIAGDFTKYDEHAVQQINRNIELIRYRKFGSDLLLFELVNATTAVEGTEVGGPSKPKRQDTTVTGYLDKADAELTDRYEALKSFLMRLGDDVQTKTLKYYFAFKRIRNFACVEIHPSTGKLSVYVKVDPDSIELQEGFTRDVRNLGHFGTGELEITIDSDEDLERAEPLLRRSYEAS